MSSQLLTALVLSCVRWVIFLQLLSGFSLCHWLFSLTWRTYLWISLYLYYIRAIDLLYGEQEELMQNADFMLSLMQNYISSVSRKPWQINLLACKKCKHLRSFSFLHSTLLTILFLPYIYGKTILFLLYIYIYIFPEQIHPVVREMS